jgi:hypothetical protein
MSSAAEGSREMVPVKEGALKGIARIVLGDVAELLGKGSKRFRGTAKPLQRLLTLPIYLVDVMTLSWAIVFPWRLLLSENVLVMLSSITFVMAGIIFTSTYPASSRPWAKKKWLGYCNSVSKRLGSATTFE